MFRSLAAIALSALCGAALADPAAAPTMNAQAAASSASPPPSADVFIYASRGQSDKQLDRDRYECHNWAVRQSHYNPSDPHLAPHQQIQVVAAPPAGRDTVAGVVSGAVTGAIIAGPHDTGEGAMIGAVAGGIMGAMSDAARKQEAAQINGNSAAVAQAERARLETQASDYRRAISACLEGRGYTVK